MAKQFDEICKLVERVNGPVKAYMWMHAKNKQLANLTPRQVLDMGKYEQLKALVIKKLGPYYSE